MNLGDQSLKRRTLAMAAMAAMAVIVVIGMVAYQLWEGYRQTIASAERDLVELRAVLSKSTEATSRSAEIIADHAIQEMARQGAHPNVPALAQHLMEGAQDWDFVYAEALFDVNGNTILNLARDANGRMAQAYPGEKPAEVFAVHQNATPATDNVYISRPFSFRIDGTQIVALSKGVYDSDGTFMGVCIVAIRLETIRELLSTLLPAHIRFAGLRRGDGRFLTSTLPGIDLEREPTKPRYAEVWPPAHPEIIRYRYQPPSMFTELLVAYQRVDDYPFVISVAAAWEDVIGPWQRNAIAAIASTLVGILLIGFLTRDIIKRVEQEQRDQRAVQKSEQSLLDSQRLSGISHFERSLATGEVVWAENMYEVHGVDKATFSPTQENFLALVVPEDRQAVVDHWKSLDEQFVGGTIECRIALPSGGIRHIRYSWKAIDEGSGRPASLFGVAQDMTPIRRAENIIREDQERLRDIVECSSDYIWETDAEGRTVFFTGPQAHKFRDADGSHPKILQLNARMGEGAALADAVRAQQKIRSVTMPWVDADGETHHIRISANPRFDAEQRFMGYRGAAADVTDVVNRRQREEVARRTEALGRLASGLAHEINNLLQPIMIYAAFGTSENGLAQSVRQYFSRIATAAERASHIVKNVLSFARDGQQQQEFVNPIEVARESIDLLSGALKPEVKVEFEANAHDVFVRANRTGLTQVVTNLVANATDALKKGGCVVIRVSTAALGSEAATLSLRPGIYCRIDVEDNGPGIAPAHIGEIFEPFFTTKPQGQGTGLELSVVSGLVKSWSGTVTVNSVPGETTCFSIYLPLVDRQLQAAQ